MNTIKITEISGNKFTSLEEAQTSAKLNLVKDFSDLMHKMVADGRLVIDNGIMRPAKAGEEYTRPEREIEKDICSNEHRNDDDDEILKDISRWMKQTDYTYILIKNMLVTAKRKGIEIKRSAYYKGGWIDHVAWIAVRNGIEIRREIVPSREGRQTQWGGYPYLKAFASFIDAV